MRGTDPDSSELLMPCLANAAARKRRASSGVAKPDRPAGCVYLKAATQVSFMSKLQENYDCSGASSLLASAGAAMRLRTYP